MFRPCIPAVACLAAALAAAGPAAADVVVDREYLRAELKKPATTLAMQFKNERPDPLRTVKFGPFTDTDVPYAAGVRELFIQEFEATPEVKNKDVTVVETDKPDVTVTATLTYVEAGPAIQVSFTVVKRRDGTSINLEKGPIRLTKAEVLTGAKGFTKSFRPNTPALERAKQVAEAIGAAPGDVVGARRDKDVPSKIMADPDRPYAVEVLTADLAAVPKDATDWDPKKNTRVTAAVPEMLAGNRPEVHLKPDQVYAVKVYNPTDYAAAVQVTIDGLDVFQFIDDKLRLPDGAPRYRFYFVRPKESLVIPGWYRDEGTSYAFVVEEYVKAKEAQPKPDRAPLRARPKSPGVICVQFAVAWTDGKKPPEDVTPRDIHTQPGKEVTTHFKEVKDVEAGEFNTVISILYKHPDKK